MMNKEAVAHNMKLIRSLTGKSMQDFGTLVGATKDQIASYENARALPQKPTILRILEIAGITENEFLTNPITKEEIVKEMFANITVNANDLSAIAGDQVVELRKVIEAMQSTINAQSRVIEMQTKMLEQFASLAS
jgi:transcriptional regulator with XRE-family HTH domain